jgi:transitional endoplasmic reticulum ATPase
MPLADDVDLAGIAAQTERYTGADLEDVVRRAGLGALRRLGGEASEVTARDFEAAVADSRATVTPRMEAEYRAMRGELKKRAVEVPPIGLFDPDTLKPENARKHAD